MRFSIILIGTVLSLAVSAKADTFTLRVHDKVDTFTLPASPLVSHSYDFGFAISSELVNENGVDLVRQIDFFNAGTGGGLLIEGPDGPDFNGQGEVLYTGSNTHPTFLPGSFHLVGADSGSLTISTNGVAPEPSSVVLLAVGLIGVFGAWRRKVSA